MSQKKGPLFWILIVVAVMVVLGGSVIALGGYFIYRAAKNAGVDTELFRTNPALATTKLAVAMNPDLEAVSVDESTGLIKVRSKSSGRVVTMRFDAQTKSLTTVTERLPDWLGAYPGTNPEGASGKFNFRTSDSPKKVLDFYATQATKAGLEVTSNSTMPGAGMLLAENRATERQVVVTISATGDVVISVAEGK